MNKYYIGYSIPDTVREKIRSLYLHIMGNAALVEVKQLHITALHIGPKAREAAQELFLALPRRTLPISCELDTYDRFGDHLVIKLKGNPELLSVHAELSMMAGKGSQDRWGYNPHITVAHGKNCFLRVACPEAKFLLPSITLFEKQPGGEYGPHLTTEFR